MASSKLPFTNGEGTWTYRSLYNNPKLSTDFNDLELGRATLEIQIKGYDISGKIYGPGWGLELKGVAKETLPLTLNIRGTGTVDGHPWIYDYLCYVVPPIKEGIDQVPAMVGAVTRVIEHPGSDGKPHRAGEVASFYAVIQDKK